MTITNLLLNDCHFSAKTVGQTIVLQALPHASLTVLGKSCHLEKTTEGAVVYPSKKRGEDVIVVESGYYGKNYSHTEHFIILMKYLDNTPEIVEVTDNCTTKKQLSINNGYLTIVTNDIAYTTSPVTTTQKKRFHVDHDTLCEYTVGIIDNSELARIAKKNKEGQEAEEAVTIKTLQKKIDDLKSELDQTKSSLRASKKSLKDSQGAISVLQEERNNLQKHLDLAGKSILENDMAINCLKSQIEELTKHGRNLVDEITACGRPNKKTLFKVRIIQKGIFTTTKSLATVLKNVANSDISSYPLNDSSER